MQLQARPRLRRAGVSALNDHAVHGSISGVLVCPSVSASASLFWLQLWGLQVGTTGASGSSRRTSAPETRCSTTTRCSRRWIASKRESFFVNPSVLLTRPTASSVRLRCGTELSLYLRCICLLSAVSTRHSHRPGSMRSHSTPGVLAPFDVLAACRRISKVPVFRVRRNLPCLYIPRRRVDRRRFS